MNIRNTCRIFSRPVFLSTILKRDKGYKVVKRPDPNMLKMPKLDDAPSIMNIIKEKVRLNGPMTVAEYMHIVITNPTEGYYMKKDVIGQQGDFVTSPEISQLFGEILAIWFYSETQKMGTGKPLQIVELGPGNGTLMIDFIRVLNKLKYKPNELSIHLVEISSTMQLLQANRLCSSHRECGIELPHNREGETVSGIKVYWYNDLKKVPENFAWYIAHEFFDVLPIHKFEHTDKGWRELLIDLDENQKLYYRISGEETSSVKMLVRPPLDAGDRTELEISPRSLGIARQLAQRVDQFGGLALIADYGHEGEKGDTFRNKEDSDRFLALPPNELRLEGQVIMVKPALKRENISKDKKQPKDNRNLYLVKEGVVVAGTKAALGVSASDMAKRLTLERSKTQMLKNLNRFVSRYRLVVSNLTPNYTDATLRRLCARFASKGAVITEARVMRDLRAPVGRDGRHPSKGYGFVMFTRHEDALACLRKLNNNPDVFDKNNRPIVSFSIEDRTALNARKKRLEKSIANNPLAKKETEDETKNKNRKRKASAPDESYVKKARFEKKNNNRNEVGKFVKRQNDDQIDEYTGLTAKEGNPHKIRNNHKLKMQADVHRQNVKMEKKKSKRSWRLKMAARERVKQPKQKINKNKTGKRNKKRKFNDEF